MMLAYAPHACFVLKHESYYPEGWSQRRTRCNHSAVMYNLGSCSEFVDSVVDATRIKFATTRALARPVGSKCDAETGLNL